MGREAVILAGGLGTRLRSVVDDIPKSLAPVNGKPFLYYLLKHLSEFNFERIVLATGYKSEQIRDYFGTHFGNLTLDYSVENEPMGTGGAILLASSLIKNDYFFAVNGDTLFKVDFNSLESSFLTMNNDLMVALKPMKSFERYGSVTMEGEKIVSFNEKKYCHDGLINGGVYIIGKKWLLENTSGEKFSFEKDLMEKIAGKGIISGFVSDTYFIDIGVPEDYSRASEELIP